MNHHEGQRKKIANPHNLEAELENILHFFAWLIVVSKLLGLAFKISRLKPT